MRKGISLNRVKNYVGCIAGRNKNIRCLTETSNKMFSKEILHKELEKTITKKRK